LHQSLFLLILFYHFSFLSAFHNITSQLGFAYLQAAAWTAKSLEKMEGCRRGLYEWKGPTSR
jgi:hypothetical protein